MKRSASIPLIFLATIGYGLMPIFTLVAYAAKTSPSELVLMRFVGAAVLMWIYYIATGRTAKLTAYPKAVVLRVVFMIGIPFTLTILVKFLAFTTMPVGIVQAIFYGYPLIVMLIGVSSGRESFYLSRLLGYMVILAGILLTMDFSDARLTVVGVLLSVASPVVYSWYILSLRHKKVIPVPSPVITTYVMTTGSVLMVLAFPFFPNNGFSFESQAWWGIAGLVLISSVGAFIVFNYGAKHVDSSLAATICCFEPIITILIEILFLGGYYTPRQMAGIVLIPSGILFSLLFSRKSKPKNPVCCTIGGDS